MNQDTQQLAARISQLEELIVHAEVHSAYQRCGYKQMTTEQKALWDEVCSSWVAGQQEWPQRTLDATSSGANSTPDTTPRQRRELIQRTHKLMDADPKSPLQEGRSSAFHAAPCSTFIAFSGGVESTTMALLFGHEAQCVFTDTGAEHKLAERRLNQHTK